MAYNTGRQVVITGLGAITPIGNTAGEFWANLKAGKSGISYITRFDPKDSPVKIAGEVRGSTPTCILTRRRRGVWLDSPSSR